MGIEYRRTLYSIPVEDDESGERISLDIALSTQSGTGGVGLDFQQKNGKSPQDIAMMGKLLDATYAVLQESLDKSGEAKPKGYFFKFSSDRTPDGTTGRLWELWQPDKPPAIGHVPVESDAPYLLLKERLEELERAGREQALSSARLAQKMHEGVSAMRLHGPTASLGQEHGRGATDDTALGS